MATWQNIAGTWKSGFWWQNVGGVWKQMNVWQNVLGVWQNLSAQAGLSAQFTPDGGDQYYSDQYNASGTLSCNVPATWTYSGGGPGSSVNRGSGTTGNSITFSTSATGGSPGNRQGRSASWNVTGTAKGITRTFTVTVEAFGDNP